MAETTITFCDRCSPNATVGGKIRSQDSRGWAEWPAGHCVAELGWERRGAEVICPDCAEEDDGLFAGQRVEVERG